ncbi:MAG TPA: aminoglycoside phosphotransferase family protein [Rhodocyclaceae bacterium]|nr:aminoglycoside phosphotransferase family protein [Rhodocyclaceae bacterium]
MNAPDIAMLLARAGHHADIHEIRILAHGGNNRTWFVDADGERYVVKQYFRHADDTRDRLKAEFDFTRYASSLLPDCVPQPIAQDAGEGLAVYRFMPGEVLRPGQIGQPEVDAAVHFFCSLNDPRRRDAASNLPEASEACFALSDHLSLIGKRIACLSEVMNEPGTDADAANLIDRLSQRWKVLQMEVIEAAQRTGLAVSDALPVEQRCVSPSDFGFHNALRDSDGTIRFLDFEYAGWDDPAKMTGDFFAQLAVPVPATYFNGFVSAALGHFPDASTLRLRAALLRPVYQIKWCCIALNVFLPVHLARRKFANPALDETALKRQQLVKAQNLFQSLEPIRHGLH